MLEYTGTWSLDVGDPPRVNDAEVGDAILSKGPAVTGSMTVATAVDGTITAQQSITGIIQRGSTTVSA